jgi:hypothetical protein
VAQDYLTIAEFKTTLELQGESFADQDIAVAITAASRAVEHFCDRRFWVAAEDAEDEVRYYTPTSPSELQIDDLVTLTDLDTDEQGDQTFSQSWTVNTSVFLEPLNAAADGRPYTRLCVNAARTSLYFPVQYGRSVRVTGIFGWPAVPSEVKQAATIIAGRLIKRARETPMGVVMAGVGFDGAAIRIASQDPDVVMLLSPLRRHQY